MYNIEFCKDIIKKKNKKKKTVIPKDYFFLDKEEIPDKIIIYLSKDIDIFQIDKTIRYRYIKLKENLYKNNKKLQKFKNEYNESVIEADKKNLKELIDKETTYIKNIEKNIIIEKYNLQSKDLLEYFKENKKDLSRVKDYLEIAKKYIKIDIIKKLEDNIFCEGCKKELDELEENQEGYNICPYCNCINSYIKPFKFVKDPEHYLLNTGDDDINNFIKVLLKFEGKNVSNIPEILYTKLDTYFLNKGMEIGNYYKNLPLTKDGKKDGTTKKKLWTALEDLGYNQYYDEITHITHVYWGWKLPDLSLYKNRIIKDYQLTQQVWQKIKKDYNRSASLGTSFRLLSHLKAVDYPYCKKEDFKIQDMVESLRLHDDAWRRMCEETGVKYYPIH